MTRPHSPGRTALVLGAAGSFGAHAAEALVRRGWTIRALSRRPDRAAAAQPRAPFEWRAGDAMRREDVIAAAQGAELIVHAANPPGYHAWSRLVPAMAESATAAALASGARLVFPGNVYNYAPDSGDLIAEGAPQRPQTRKGAIRVQVEEDMARAADRGARILILRAGDFFGPAARNNALAWLTRRSAGRVRTVYHPGPVSVGHAFAYLPDLAEAMGRLVDAEDRLDRFERVHFRGHWADGDASLLDAVRTAQNDPSIPGRPFPWAVITALSPAVEMLRELREMRYLWRQPIGLDNAHLRALIGPEPHTPFATAVGAALEDLGCAPAAAAREARPAVA